LSIKARLAKKSSVGFLFATEESRVKKRGPAPSQAKGKG
jgi:hypothetical protein